jgi:hypothetical protein
MIRKPLVLLAIAAMTLGTDVPAVAGQDADKTAETTWPVAASLKATLRSWALREGWPAPQFLTDADWPVDVPGSVPGSMETALKMLVQGFGHASSRPRIEITANHVIVVSETGAE